MLKTIFSNNYIALIVAVSVLVLTSTIASGEEAPILIEADHMSSTAETNTVLFTGDVDAKQGDLRIRSDEMTVYYGDLDDDDGKKAAKTTQRIEKLICIGNVEITRADWLGTSEKMTYLSKQREVILTGNAKAWQDQNMVAGDKIIYYMDDGRSEVVGGTSTTIGATDKKEEKKSRVKMTILQQ